MDNGFTDLWNAFRKYILPPGMGGGYTPEEAEKIKKDLETAYNNTEANKNRNEGIYDPSEPVVEYFTGIPQELQGSNGLLAIGAVVALILILRD